MTQFIFGIIYFFIFEYEITSLKNHTIYEKIHPNLSHFQRTASPPHHDSDEHGSGVQINASRSTLWLNLFVPSIEVREQA